MPGFNPVMAQFDVWQMTVMGLPPPNGVAVHVKGPVAPGPGRITATAVVGLVGSTARDGALQRDKREKCVTVCGAPMIEAQTLGLASRPSPPLLRDTQRVCETNWHVLDSCRSCASLQAGSSHLVSGVVTVLGGDARVGLPLASMPLAETW